MLSYSDFMRPYLRKDLGPAAGTVLAPEASAVGLITVGIA